MNQETVTEAPSSLPASDGEAVRPVALTWQDGDPAVAVAADVALDAALQPLHGAVVRVTGTLDGVREVLMHDLSGLGLLAGRPKGGATDRIDLYLFNRASAADYETALRSIQYVNRSPEPTPGTRQVTVEVIDATALTEVVLQGSLEIPAPDAYEFLSPDLLQGTFERLAFDPFDYSAPPAPPIGLMGDKVYAGPPRDPDVFAAMGEDGADAYHLHRPARRAALAVMLESQPGATVRTPELMNGEDADGGYWVLTSAVAEAEVGDRAETTFLEASAYRLFRERHPARDTADGLFAESPSADEAPATIHVESISDSAPVVAVADSVARRQARDRELLKDAA